MRVSIKENKKLKTFVFFTMLCVLIFSSCSTLGRDDNIYSTTTAKDNVKNIDEIERAIIVQYKEYDAKKLADIKIELDKLIAKESADFNFLAKVHSLYADYYLLNRSKRRAGKMLEKAKYYNPNNELVLILNSRFMDELEEKIEYLEKIKETNPDYYRVKAELGFLYYENKEYTKALVAFDSALDFLPEEYRTLYQEKREYCKKFYNVDSEIETSSTEILNKDKIYLYEMTQLSQDNTNSLDFITGTAKWKPMMLAEKLKANNWYADSVDLEDGYVYRKDAALFLWHLIVGNDTRKLSKYSRRYEKRGGRSPISDVALDGVYFDSILGTVEEDIIPLIDGVRFEPNKYVSGLDFYNWLKKADKIKNY